MCFSSPKQLLYLRHNNCTKRSSLSVVKFNKNPYLCPVNPIALDKNFHAMKTIKIFLGSSITELHDERVILGDYLMNSVRPIFKNDGIEVEVLKCEDIRSGNTGTPPQNKIDKLIRECDVSVFMFKTKAGDMTIHEFDVARKLQKRKRHEIYVYCFNVVETEKSQELKDFQDRLIKEPFYWYDCKDVTDLESQFILGLLKYERQLLGMQENKNMELGSATEKDDDALFEEFKNNKQKIHQRIDELLQQTETVMANEDETIAARIFKVIELYKKADRWAAATDYDKEKYSDLLYDYAQFLNKYGLYIDAEEVFLRQISIAEELYGNEDEKTAISYNGIGMVYRNQGEYDKALGYYHKAIEIREKALGMNHRDTATSYNDIGGVYKDMGDYDNALKYYFKALEIRKIILGTDHPDTGRTYNNIGSVYDDLNDNDLAINFYFMAMSIVELKLGIEHTDTATAYNNIGWVYRKQGEYDKSLEYHNKALEIDERVNGKDHPNTAIDYNNIGKVLIEQCLYTDAFHYLYKALLIKKMALGDKHFSTAISYYDIGKVFYYQGDYQTALKLYSTAYLVFKKKLGENHPKTKDVLKSIDFVKETMKSSR